MAHPERSPLLAAASRPGNSRRSSEEQHESAPLLSNLDTTVRYDNEREGTSTRGGGADASPTKDPKIKSRRLPSIIAMILLAFLSAVIIIVGFFVPAAVEEYTKEAAVFEPTNLSLESITTTGVRARVQAIFKIDGSRVENDQVRGLGRAATWLVRTLGTEETEITVYLPEYENIVLGTAKVPPLVVDVVDGHNTPVDFVVEAVPGNADGIRTIANEWLEGKLDLLRIRATADVQVKSGIIPLGTHSISESLIFQAKELPALPQYNISRLKVHETPVPGEDRQGMAVDVSLKVFNEYPVSIDIPELGFDIFVSGCSHLDPYILVASAVTQPVAVRPSAKVLVRVGGLVRELPESLSAVCPGSDSSPLDILLQQFLDGQGPTVFVRGAAQTDADIPNWLARLLSSVTLPIPFPAGSSFENLIRNFTLSDVHFSLPNPAADPEDPDANPTVSGIINVIAALPTGMNFDLNVTNVKATADVFYKSDKLGELILPRWQDANSTRISLEDGPATAIKIESRIRDAPLNVTDGDILTEIIQKLLVGDEGVTLDIKAAVDIKVQAVLGQLVLKNIPAEGRIPVKPLPKDTLAGLDPEVGNITVVETTSTSIKFEALVNITNPTLYSAYAPFVGIHILSNGSIIGEANAKDLVVRPGENTNLELTALWNPSQSGSEGVKKGRDLLSEYLSGYNTTLTLQTHRNSIPFLPHVGESLAKLNLTISAPSFTVPGDSKDDTGSFIRDATFHVFSSAATFSLFSPFQRNTLYLDRINATAFYNHTEPVGKIEYNMPFACPPGTSQTPRLPVEWSLGSVGYEKLKNALGGRLKLDAKAIVDVRLGAWEETVWYIGHGIGAKVSI